MKKVLGCLWAGFAMVVLINLAGCGGGSDDGPTASSSTTTPAGSLSVTSSIVAPGATCPNGGISVDSGIDENKNGSLDADEVDATQYVCNGIDGSSGANGSTALVSISPEPSGTNCQAGGNKVESGLDTSNDGVLDGDEITHTNYLCDGQDGNDGASGTDGLTTLLAIIPEPAGANCAYGGQLITSGLDIDHDNILDAGEITSTGYACSGAPAGIGWLEVTGITQQADANMGYIANNPEQVTITLPTSPAIGDIVEVVGNGAGGWKIAQNDGQTIFGMAAQRAWTGRGLIRNWYGVASSADGSKLVAVADGGSLMTSTDGGVTWVTRLSGGSWRTVASSSDGAKLVGALSSGQIYTSINSGASWTSQSVPALNWISVASSSDGAKLIAAPYGGYIYTSIDSGVTWTARTSSPSTTWRSVASSSDGAKLIAVQTLGYIYTSIDSGATWTAGYSAGTKNWASVASSSDGTKLVAAPYLGYIYTSIDSGATWTAAISSPTTEWEAVTMSADSSTILAASYAGYLFISTDSGATWVQQNDVRLLTSGVALATSADANVMVAGEVGGKIYTRRLGTSPGIAGELSGQQWDTVKLQYVGTGTFVIRSYDGELLFY